MPKRSILPLRIAGGASVHELARVDDVRQSLQELPAPPVEPVAGAGA